MKARVLVLFCGGTAVMVKNEQGSLEPPSRKKALSSVLSIEPRLFDEVDLQVHFISNEDSSNMTSSIWDEMTQTIYNFYEEFDGFVILHGTDTMAFTSSALSLSLQGIGKPVVCTGSQIPGERIDSDVRLNFVNAVHLATQDISGVMILFGHSIFHGARVTKTSHTKLEAFSSVNAPLLGTIGRQMQLCPLASKRHQNSIELQLGFDANIGMTSLFPGCSPDFLFLLLSHGVKALILTAYGMGNVSTSYLPFLKKAQESKIPVIIRTHCLEGTTCMHTYETGRQALSFGVIEAYDMSFESTVVKLMWALGKKVPYHEMRAFLYTDKVGEIKR